VAIKASLNLGLSDQLTVAFPNLKPVSRPLVKDQKVPHEQWLAGFISGEGCFFVKIFKSNTNMGEAVSLGFKLTQHSRDEALMRSEGGEGPQGGNPPPRPSLYKLFQLW